MRRIVGQNYSSNNAGVRIKTVVMSVPVQFLPSLTSVNPELQLHTRDPCVLVHSCAQPPLFLLHSFISMYNEDIERIIRSEDMVILQPHKLTTVIRPWPLLFLHVHAPLVIMRLVQLEPT